MVQRYEQKRRLQWYKRGAAYHPSPYHEVQPSLKTEAGHNRWLNMGSEMISHPKKYRHTNLLLLRKEDSIAATVSLYIKGVSSRKMSLNQIEPK